MPIRSNRVSAAVFGALAGALIVFGTTPDVASAQTAVVHLSPAKMIGSPSASPAPLVIPVVNQSARNRFKRQRIRQCCQKYRSGLPLKGYLCSLREVWRAWRDGTCTFDYPPPYRPRGVFH